MGNLVIVAIPEEQDRVWKISSEKVPHLTLLFLGDADSNPNVQQVMEFVQHAVDVSEHGQFYLDVDRRDVLGADEADVVFFSKRSWNLKWIKQFRSQLLQNDAIRTAYDSTEQFPEWQPHLTLGYPTAPANELDGAFDHPIYSVCFDRIAVWTGDFDGPDFRLEWPDRELSDDLAVAYSGTGKSVLDELLHVGVKGMKWGVRKENFHRSEAQRFRNMAAKAEGKGIGPLKGKAAQDYHKQAQKHENLANKAAGKNEAKATKKATKLDKSWEKNQFTLAKGVERHNAMAEHFNSRIGALNDKHKNDDFSKEAFDSPAHWSPKYKEYMNGVAKLEEAGFRHAVTQVHGTSPTGKKKMTVEYTPDGDLRMVVKNTDAAHAAVDSGDEVFLFKVTRNSNGLITAVEPSDNLTTNEMAQTGSFVDDYLAHYGIKGMRWGQRKVDVASGAKAVAKGAGKAAKGAAKTTDDVLFELGRDNEHVRSEIARTAHVNLKVDDLPGIKANHPVGGKLGNRLKKPLSPEAKAYRKDVKAAYLKQLEAAANEHTNFQGTRRYTLKEYGQPNTSQYFWGVSTEGTPAKHAASAPFRVRPIFDKDGYIVDFEYMPNELAQTESFVDDYLAHYGIKGMRWGSRKSSEVTPTSVAVKTTPHDRKTTKVEVKGGGGHDAHPDAIKVAEARQKLRKSGSAALSNSELKDVAERLQLESNVARLEGERKSGSTFVGKLLRKHGSQQLDRGINRAAGQVTDDAATRVGRAATKKIFKAGVAAAV